MIYAVILIILVLAPLLGLIPKVVRNGRASLNNLTRIEVAPEQVYLAKGQSYHGSYAQERIEWHLKWLAAVALSVPVAVASYYIADGNPLWQIAPIFALLAGLAIRQLDSFKRQMELLGHTVESVVAAKYGHDLETYLVAEAARTQGNTISYPFLVGTNVEAAMRRRLPIARVFAALHALPIKRL